MTNFLSGLIVIWLALSSYFVGDIINKKVEKCESTIMKGEYVEEVISLSLMWPMLIFINADNLESSGGVDCSMTKKFINND